MMAKSAITIFNDSPQHFAYKNFVDAYEVDHLRARNLCDAGNSKRLLALKTNRHRTSVIHGKVEADLIQQAEWQGNLSKDVDYLYMDVGGGSTEYSLHRGKEVIKSKYLTSTIRLLADKVKKSEWQMQSLQELSTSPRNIEFVGSGGSINTAHKLSKRPSNAVLDYAYIKKLYEQIDRLTVDERIVLTVQAGPSRCITHSLEIVLKKHGMDRGRYYSCAKFGLSDGMIRALCHQHS